MHGNLVPSVEVLMEFEIEDSYCSKEMRVIS